jgi:hypothetical protein
LNFLDERLGHLRYAELDRERLITFGKAPAAEGAGPVTVGMDLGYIKEDRRPTFPRPSPRRDKPIV